MTKTMEELREDYYERTSKDSDLCSPTYSNKKIADYWLSIIDQRDRELREEIEKLKRSSDSSTYLYEQGESNAYNKVLSLLSPHNKENER